MINLAIDWKHKTVCVKHKKLKHKTPHLEFSILYRGATFIGKSPMAFLLPDDRTAQVNVAAVDAAGNPSIVENIRYSSSTPAVATISDAGLITPLTLGDTQINVIADALIGEGDVDISGILDVTVVGGQAVSLNLSATLV